MEKKQRRIPGVGGVEMRHCSKGQVQAADGNLISPDHLENPFCLWFFPRTHFPLSTIDKHTEAQI